MTDKKTKEELIKESSNYLRGTIKEELVKDSSHFEEVDSKLLKFHGIYQQDNRDTRQERIAKQLEKEYIFMIRTKLPGGQLTPEQYLSLNTICDKYSNKTLRITTRQTIQFHGVIKGNLHKTLNEINKNLILTYGACGDVVRNIMACPVCDIDPEYSINLNELAREISNHLLPNTRSYYEIWIDEEKISEGLSTNDKPERHKESADKSEAIYLNRGALIKEEEPLYGKTYLPRKFKIGLTLPNDNCIDVFTQDVGVVAVVEECVIARSGSDEAISQKRYWLGEIASATPRNDVKLLGFNILVGGGLGHHHNKSETYPRLASPLGFIKPEKLITTLEKIVTIQRDYGGRENRKHARLKYLIDDRGINWFKSELENRVGACHGEPLLESFKEIKEYVVHDHLGWHKQINGRWYLGLFIENGRICDQDGRKIKNGLKEIVEKFKATIRLTPQQNIILVNIKEEDKNKVDELVKKYNIFTKETISQLRRNSMACPALPTCGLALAEAERVLPNIIDELEKLGFKDEVLSIRMSGCPNSCSRPPVAELGIIGMSANKYNIYVGGNFEGTRLNKLYKENILGEDVVPEIRELFKIYHAKRNTGEKFGDFCNRIGIGQIKEFINQN